MKDKYLIRLFEAIFNLHIDNAPEYHEDCFIKYFENKKKKEE